MHSLPDDALPETPFLSPFSDRACPGFVSLFDSIPSLPLYSRALVLARTQEYCSMPPTRRVPSTGSHEVHS